MNIIIGKHNLEGVDSKHIVLELDTFHLVPVGEDIQAYCVVENIPIDQLPQVENLRELHQSLITGYRDRRWDHCLNTIEHLMGAWGGELRTFYQELSQRIQGLREQDPGADWDWRIPKQVA